LKRCKAFQVDCPDNNTWCLTDSDPAGGIVAEQQPFELEKNVSLAAVISPEKRKMPKLP
jgi:hypothetical protein